MPQYDPVGVRRLAVAVLASAMYDAAGLAEVRSAWRGRVGGGVRGTDMTVDEVAAEAYDWLTTPSERLEFWAEAAGLDMETVIDGADAAVAYATRTPRGVSILGDVRNSIRMKGRRA